MAHLPSWLQPGTKPEKFTADKALPCPETCSLTLKLFNSNYAWTNHPLQATHKTYFSVFEMESHSHHCIQTMKVNKTPSYFLHKNPLLDFNGNSANGIITVFALKISSICRNWIFQEDNQKTDLLKCVSTTNAGLQAPLRDKLNDPKDAKWFYFYSSGVL